MFLCSRVCTAQRGPKLSKDINQLYIALTTASTNINVENEQLHKKLPKMSVGFTFFSS